MARREAILPDGLEYRLAAHVKAGHRLIGLLWDDWFGVYFSNVRRIMNNLDGKGQKNG